MVVIMKSYTYLLRWSEYDMSYYGFRCGNKSDPIDDLWKKYFTSSSYVKKFREEFGDPDIVLVDREFEDKLEAKLYETTYLRSVGVPGNEKWLNKSDGSKHFFHGNSHSDESKKKMSEKKSGSRRKPMSDETKRKIGLTMLGNTRGQKPGSNAKRSSTLTGRKLAPGHAEKISKAKKGKKFTPEHCLAISISKKKDKALNTFESRSMVRSIENLSNSNPN